MRKNSIKMTVLFDSTFWIGLYERIEDDKLQVAKVTFGAESRDFEILAYNEQFFYDLKFGKAHETEKDLDKHINPKRLQRKVKNEVEKQSVTKKSWQAIKKQQEENKMERRKKSKKLREEESLRKFQLKQEKKRQKQKGH